MAGKIHMTADFVLTSKRADMQESELTSISEDFGRQGINVDDVRQRGTKQKITFILTMDLPDCFNQFNVTRCMYIKPTPVRSMARRPRWV